MHLKPVLESLVLNLTDKELDELKNIVHNEEIKRITLNAHTYPNLTDDEKRMAEENEKIRAIRSYRERTGYNLMVAKWVVENYLGN